ncbi:MAG: ELM1/GtrOC1 family putative glycosyltransferase [Shinella sp.]|nr:ELM1/GtrOC1 family putative glycosyltransferase [Shinella sp.]
MNTAGSEKLRAWVVSEPKVGTLTQCTGVAVHFDPEPDQRIVVVRHGIKRLLAPPMFRKSEAAPDLIISCGFRPEKPVLKMQRAFGGHPLTVHLQRPEIEGYDLCFVSRHDWTPDLDDRENFHSMVGVPHRLTPERLASLEEAARSRYAPAGERVAAVFVGGSNGAYVYDDSALRRIVDAIRQLADQGWRLLVSTSRRSEQHTFETLRALRSDTIDVWDRQGENPYLDYVAAADAFLIAKDSITMPCEALTTGKPVYSLDLTAVPGERFAKFERYHDDLQNVLKLTRKFGGTLDAYDYTPLAETPRIAGIIREALEKKRG